MEEIDDIEIESPVNPSKIVCIGLNYKDHAKEMNEELPENPTIFIKPSTAVNKTDAIVIYPKIWSFASSALTCFVSFPITAASSPS